MYYGERGKKNQKIIWSLEQGYSKYVLGELEKEERKYFERKTWLSFKRNLK